MTSAKKAKFHMRWNKGAAGTYFSADDLVMWTYRLEELNGSSSGLGQLRELMESFRATHNLD